MTCPACGETVLGYVSAEAVKRGGNLAGFGLMPVASIISAALSAAAVRCEKCEKSTH